MFCIVVLLTCIYPYIASAIYAAGPYGSNRNCHSPESIGDLFIDGQKIHLQKFLAGGSSACVYTTDLKYGDQEAVAKCYKSGQEDAMKKEEWALIKMDSVDRERGILTPPRHFGRTGYFLQGEARACLIEARLHGVPFEETTKWASIIGRGREVIGTTGDLKNKQCVELLEWAYDQIAHATLDLAKTYGILHLDPQMQNVYWHEDLPILLDFGSSMEVTVYEREISDQGSKTPDGMMSQTSIRTTAHNTAKNSMDWEVTTRRGGRCGVTLMQYLDLVDAHSGL
ncbi:hypothetical protein FRC03_006410 [Tulasnella sp. 419]|nr:hypothetical protein FRC03_006410 [Tulasnella sp. 419]